MRLSKTHLKALIKEELKKHLYEQESRTNKSKLSVSMSNKVDAIEARIRLEYDLHFAGPLWEDKASLKLLWKSLFSINRAPGTQPNISWDAIGKMSPTFPWGPEDPPHWIPPVSDSVCSAMRNMIKKPNYACKPTRRINVNDAIDSSEKFRDDCMNGGGTWNPETNSCRKQSTQYKEVEKDLLPPWMTKCPPGPDGRPRNECPELGFEAELVLEVALLIIAMKSGATGFLANPYVLIGLFGAAVVWMAIDLVNEVGALDEKIPQVAPRPPTASDRSTQDAMNLMRLKGNQGLPF
jgi:hypothetical protein